MLRIRFNTKEDRLRGLSVLLENTVSRRLRGDIFEIADEDRKLLDEHELHYTVIPFDPSDLDHEIRIPVTYEVQRRHGNPDGKTG